MSDAATSITVPFNRLVTLDTSEPIAEPATIEPAQTNSNESPVVLASAPTMGIAAPDSNVSNEFTAVTQNYHSPTVTTIQPAALQSPDALEDTAYEALTSPTPPPLTMDNIGQRLVQFVESNGGTVTPALQTQVDKIEYGLNQNIPGHPGMGAYDGVNMVAEQFGEVAMPFYKETLTMIRDSDGTVNTMAERLSAEALNNMPTIEAMYKHEEPKPAVLAMR